MRLRFAHRSLRARRPAVHDGHRQRHARLVLRPGADRGARRARSPAASSWPRPGAGIVDVGGMTAQPGRVLSEDEEIARIEPVVRGLRPRLEMPISVDTYRAGVADAALRAGADLVNDHTGLSDPEHGGDDRRPRRRARRHPPRARAEAGADGPPRGRGRRDRRASWSSAPRRPRAAGVARRRDPGRSRARLRQGHRHRPARRCASCRGWPASAIRCCSRPSHKEVTAEPLGLAESALEGTAAVVAVAAYLGVGGAARARPAVHAPRSPRWAG